MSLSALSKYVDKKRQALSFEDNDVMMLLKKQLRGKPFWINGREAHKKANDLDNLRTKGSCCFNHIIGLPRKNGKELPMFDYELMTIRALLEDAFLNSIPYTSALYLTGTLAEQRAQRINASNIPAYSFKNKHLWVKKATGLGITELMLRFMAWLCLRNDEYKGSQMCIVTGPNQSLSVKLIQRMKALFHNSGITFDSKETVLNLNGCSIEAYPSNHLDSMRSLTNPKFILLEEGDFFSLHEQQNARDIAERYIGKSDPYIVLVSTPNRPEGLFDRIEKEPFETCIYKKVYLDYTYGLGKIYTSEEIDKAKMSPSFPREYELKYTGLIGNVFSPYSIDNCTKIDYDPNIIVRDAKKSIGVDPSFGSSKFAIVVTQFVNGKIQVIFAEEYDRDHSHLLDMLNRIWEIKERCGYISNVYVDAANAVCWQALKKQWGDRYTEQAFKDQVASCKQYNIPLENRMKIVPISFGSQHKQMLQHTKNLIEDPDGLVAINKRYNNLLIALRTAVANEYDLDKDKTVNDDILDAFRLSLIRYRFK